MLREKDLELLLSWRFFKEGLRFFLDNFLFIEDTDFGVLDLFFLVLLVFFVTADVLFLTAVFETFFFFKFFPFDKEREIDLEGDLLSPITCLRIIYKAALFCYIFLFFGVCFLESWLKDALAKVGFLYAFINFFCRSRPLSSGESSLLLGKIHD